MQDAVILTALGQITVGCLLDICIKIALVAFRNERSAVTLPMADKSPGASVLNAGGIP
jgi:hypothetical protein